MIEWKRVPWTLWAYSVVALLESVAVAISAGGPVAPKLLLVIAMCVWLYFLLGGVRWVWIASIALYVLSVIPYVVGGSVTWRGVVLSITGAILLGLPITRRYFIAPPPREDVIDS